MKPDTKQAEALIAAALKMRADSGDPTAQLELGQRYDTGLGVQQDFDEAMAWYHKASTNGVVEAKYNIGVLYDRGRGVEANPNEAMKWYLEAAEAGDCWAENNIGFLYAQGRGVERDDDEALRWYRRAAEKGHFSARFNLGARYAQGNGVEVDLCVAHMWFSVAQHACTPVEFERAKQAKEALESEMDATQLKHAQGLFSAWADSVQKEALDKPTRRVPVAPDLDEQ